MKLHGASLFERSTVIIGKLVHFGLIALPAMTFGIQVRSGVQTPVASHWSRRAALSRHRSIPHSVGPAPACAQSCSDSPFC